MKVVVWCSYGEIDVYAADTPQQLTKVIDMMCESVEGWGLEKKITLVREHIEKHPDDYAEIRRAFTTMVNAVHPGSHESFEKIQIKEVK